MFGLRPRFKWLFYYEIGLESMSKAAKKRLPQFIAAAQSKHIISPLKPIPGHTRYAPVE